MYKFFFSIIISFFLPLSVSAELADTVVKIKKSIVGIGVHTPTGRPQNILQGSGFVIGNGRYVVTNVHVISKKLDENLLQEMAVFVGSGKTATVRKAEVVGISEKHDLALLKIKGYPLPALNLAEAKLKREGEYIAFTGFPIGAVLGLYPVTHRGIIAAITPTITPVNDAKQLSIKVLKSLRNPFMVYQLDATAYPGNSGSAMFDIKTGEVVGIINKVYVQETKETVISKPSGITYAIPVKYLHQLLEKHNISI